MSGWLALSPRRLRPTSYGSRGSASETLVARGVTFHAFEDRIDLAKRQSLRSILRNSLPRRPTGVRGRTKPMLAMTLSQHLYGPVDTLSGELDATTSSSRRAILIRKLALSHSTRAIDAIIPHLAGQGRVRRAAIEALVTFGEDSRQEHARCAGQPSPPGDSRRGARGARGDPGRGRAGSRRAGHVAPASRRRRVSHWVEHKQARSPCPPAAAW